MAVCGRLLAPPAPGPTRAGIEFFEAADGSDRCFLLTMVNDALGPEAVVVVEAGGRVEPGKEAWGATEAGRGGAVGTDVEAATTSGSECVGAAYDKIEGGKN
jgi:hypothetical protein